MTGQSLFGQLKGGLVVQVGSALARRLLDPGCALLSTLGHAMPFEIAVGVNGLVWVSAARTDHAAAVATAIEGAEHLDEAQCAGMAAAVAGAVAARGGGKA